MTIDDALRGSAIVRSEALLLLAHASGRTRESLLASSQATLDTTVATSFEMLVRRRVDGEPIAYLLGRREFYGRDFSVDANVLIPRPDTELLVDLAIAHLAKADDARPSIVLDLGTGSGIVAITLALEVARARVTGTDVSPTALAVATRNAARLGADVAWRAGDWFAALADDAAFDLIVSNPPYIAAHDHHLREGDLRFEPALALTDGSDGLAAIRRIVGGATTRLRAGGALMIEHGHEQAASVRALFETAGYIDVASVRDLASIERVTTGRLPAPTFAGPRRDG